jgi:hypothetical protein
VFTGGSVPILARCCSTESAASGASLINAPGSAADHHWQDRTVPQDPLRTELLTGHWFDSLPQTQQMLDAWVDDYNYRRPIPGHCHAGPAEGFRPAAAATRSRLGAPARRPVTVGPTRDE